MCLIIDANVAAQAFVQPVSPDIAPVLEWLHSGKGRVAFGGRNTQELSRIAGARRLLVQWERAGLAYRVDPGKLELTERMLRRSEICKSNDIHMLALAQVSGARLIFTLDRALQQDFRNKAIIDKPRGRVYASARNTVLLRRDLCRRAT